jgi:cyclophilin family peptidyl-prolyl cis-trans isomerase
VRALASAFLLSASLAIAGCGSSDGSGASAAATAAPVATSPASAASTPATASGSSASASTKVKQGTCAQVSAPPVKSASVPKPQGKLDPSKDNVVTFKTSCGTIVIKLDAKDDPITANAVAWLVKHKYYDKTIFHRVVPNFVVQGGDPTQSGDGGPSWKVTEAPKSTQTYPDGTVAMAKTGADPAGTVQSQFFIMAGGGLDPSYAVAGKVTSGMDAVNAMEGLAASQDGPPSRTIELIKATFSAK